MEYDENERRDEMIIKNTLLPGMANLIKMKDIIEVSKSICKIKYSNIVGTGFFIKLYKKDEPFYCLMSCEHVITEKMIDSGESIKVLYNNENDCLTINLYESERFIRNYRYLNIDTTVIQILDKDNIKKDLFLLPNYDYKNGYEKFENKEIYILQYPGGNEISNAFGNITKINIYSHEFTHLGSTLPGSSGSPILLKKSKTVLGIHKQGNKTKNENYGNFIGPIVDSIKNDFEFIKNKNDDSIEEYEIINKNTKMGKFRKKGELCFVGLLVNDLREGRGILFHKNNKKIYEGEFHDNKYEGKGKLYNNIGGYYIGDFIDGLYFGKGKKYDKNNNLIYEGDFAFGKEEGKGKKIYENGNYYIGDFIGGKREGNGQLYNKINKLLYEGEFKNDQKEGYGTQYSDNKKCYICQFVGGIKSGNGLIIDKNNRLLYEGEFNNDKEEGKGKMYFEDGSYYIGEFSDGYRAGKGKQFKKNGKLIYEGDYKLNNIMERENYI